MIQEVQFAEAMETFEKLTQAKQPFIAIFTSQKDANGETWCPDCKAAAPFWPQVAKNAEAQKMKTYMFYVGPREHYKTPEHPYRTHKIIKLKCIPTLAWYDGNAIAKRLEQSEIVKKQMRELFFE